MSVNIVEIHIDALPESVHTKVNSILARVDSGYAKVYSWTDGDRRGHLIRFFGIDSRYIIVTEGHVTSLIPDMRNLYKVLEEHFYRT